jgi:GH25 family lysozyme M1 (1,4-beta-N-acetylmuramidase)
MTGRILSTAILAAWSLPAPASAVFQDGVDVLTHQGTITWSSVKSAGIKFAYTKATEGVDFVDNKFTTNIGGCESCRRAYRRLSLRAAR